MLSGEDRSIDWKFNIETGAISRPEGYEVFLGKLLILNKEKSIQGNQRSHDVEIAMKPRDKTNTEYYEKMANVELQQG